jgi:glucose/arabinose dehydrogenase
VRRSLSNIARADWPRRRPRAIYELDLTSGRTRIFAAGAAQPRGPGLGAAHRRALDGVSTSATALGDETPPDYLTSVREGGFYGWTI